MLVFRDGARRVALRPLLAQLVESCRRASGADHAAVLAALLRAGGLECALADADSPAAVPIARVTDALADALVAGSALDAASVALLRNPSLGDVPEFGRLSAPEGFAYYALHPMDYSEAVARLPFPRRAVVIGI